MFSMVKRQEEVYCSGGIASRIFNLGTGFYLFQVEITWGGHLNTEIQQEVMSLHLINITYLVCY
jgi:hypothetical protein